jgi:hypothetical protein
MKLAKHALASVMLVWSLPATSTAGPHDVPAAYAVGEAVVNGDYATGCGSPVRSPTRATLTLNTGSVTFTTTASVSRRTMKLRRNGIEKAADQGHGSAQHNLAYTYKDVRKISPNIFVIGRREFLSFEISTC